MRNLPNVENKPSRLITLEKKYSLRSSINPIYRQQNFSFHSQAWATSPSDWRSRWPLPPRRQTPARRPPPPTPTPASRRRCCCANRSRPIPWSCQVFPCGPCRGTRLLPTHPRGKASFGQFLFKLTCLSVWLSKIWYQGWENFKWQKFRLTSLAALDPAA